MPLGRSLAVAVLGIEGHLVEVEAHLSPGLPQFTLVGLPDTALSESRDRVRAAVLTSGEPWPGHRITVSLSPAALPKRGSGFDLAIACAILAGEGALPSAAVADRVCYGELGLDGRLRPLRGVLPAVLAAVRAGRPRVVVPAANVAEATLVPGAEVCGVASLRHLCALLRGEAPPADALEPPGEPGEPPGEPRGPDLADVRGQAEARLALEIAAAGGHHLLLVGAPGAGKTMLAERLPGLLPPLEHAAALEVTTIHSVAGTLPPGQPLVRRPPFWAPHHNASVAALVGGGSGVPRPGAASLAHRGVLFLDEAPEFAATALDALRQPLECGTITVSRAAATVQFPARFLLVLAANPCPCGRFFDRGARCVCPPLAVRRYLGRLSGPLLDRVDLRVRVEPVRRVDLLDRHSAPEPSGPVAARVAAARQRARRRYAGTPWQTNAEVPGRALRAQWWPEGAMGEVSRALETGLLSARGLDRVLRVSWTLADLGGRDRPTSRDVATALYLRTGTVDCLGDVA